MDTTSWGVGGVGSAAEGVLQGTGQDMAGGADAMRSAAQGAAGVVTSASAPLRQAGDALNNLSVPVTAAPKPKSKTQCLI